MPIRRYGNFAATAPIPISPGGTTYWLNCSAALRAGRATSTTQVITGLGGQGKTRLVVEYAIRYACAYDLVWWIRAEDPATMRGDYVELAQELGLPAEKDDQAIAALRKELRQRRDWLLIFDNAEDDRELFPPDSSGLLPERHSGHVLVTSRRRDWPQAETAAPRRPARPGRGRVSPAPGPYGR